MSNNKQFLDYEGLKTYNNEINKKFLQQYEIVESGIGLSKAVPEDVLPYAEVNKIGGMSYKSKNLFIASQVNKTALGLTMSYSNGLIKINGTKIDGANVQSVAFPNVILPAGTYTISCKMVGGSITPSESFQHGVFFAINKSDYAQRTTPGVAKVGGVGTKVITLSEPTVISSFDIIPDFSGAGTVFNNALFEMQFEAGSAVTDYQEGFEGLRDSKVTELKSIGANVLNIEGNEFGQDKWFRTMNNGLTVHSFAAGKYTFTSKDNYLNITNYDSNGYHWLSRFVKLEPNTNYRLSISGISCIIVGLNDNAINTVGTQLTLTNKVFNSGNYKYWMISFYSTGASNVMISKGEQVQEFAPYKESYLAIPAAVQALDGYGLGVSADYHNYINWNPDNNIKTWNVNVTKLELTGEEYWTLNTSWNNAFVLQKSFNAYESPNNLCSHYAVHTGSWQTLPNNGFGLTTAYLGIKDDRYADTTAFKNFLRAQYAAGTPVTVIYVMNTPKVVDISDLLTTTNMIDVEPNGTLTFVNEYNNAVPYEVKHYNGNYYNIAGNLLGTAEKARCDEEGNNIAAALQRISDGEVVAELNLNYEYPEWHKCLTDSGYEVAGYYGTEPERAEYPFITEEQYNKIQTAKTMIFTPYEAHYIFNGQNVNYQAKLSFAITRSTESEYAPLPYPAFMGDDNVAQIEFCYTINPTTGKEGYVIVVSDNFYNTWVLSAINHGPGGMFTLTFYK